MIFTVSKELKSNLILSTIHSTFRPGALVSIEGDNLNSPEVLTSVEMGLLIPKDKEAYKKSNSTFDESKLVISNKTGKLLVIGDITMRPDVSIVVLKSSIDMSRLSMAAERGQIDISNYGSEEVIEIDKKIKDVPKSDDNKEEEKVEEEITEDTKEEVENHTRVWDFRSQTLIEGEKVPTSAEPIHIDDDSETEKETDKPDVKKSKKIKKSKKKKVNKKGKKVETKKVKVAKRIQPVGEVREPSNTSDAILDLDERGKPKAKVSDTLQDIINNVDAENNDTFFVDNEQKKEILEKREDINA